MSRRQRPAAAAVVAGFTALALGWWWAAVVTALSIGLLSAFETRVVQQSSTAAAAALIMGAAVATVFTPELTPRWRSTFALDRPVANLLGALAAVFVVLRLATGVGGDRARWPQPAPFDDGTSAFGGRADSSGPVPWGRVRRGGAPRLVSERDLNPTF